MIETSVPPYAHQANELEGYALAYARALLWQMRSGKTPVTIWDLAYLWLMGLIDAATIIAPSGVHLQWALDEIPRHCPVPYFVHAWRTGERAEEGHQAAMAQLLKSDALPIFCINSEILHREDVKAMLRRIVKHFGGRVFAVVDESQDFRTPGSKRTLFMRTLMPRCLYRRILTGTVACNKPRAIFSQFELLQPGALGYTSVDKFEGRYVEYEHRSVGAGQTRLVPTGTQNEDELRQRMAPWSSVVLRSDCPDLPPLIRARRYLELVPAQEAAYKKLRKEFMLEFDNGAQLTAEDARVRVGKLQQILSGWTKDDTGHIQELVAIDKCPRIALLKEELALTTGKAVVWCRFRHDVERVTRAIKDRPTFVYYGGMATWKRRDNLEAFRSDEGSAVLVGTREAGGTGLNLSCADHIVGFSHSPDLVARDQADDRCTEMKGEPVSVTDLSTVGTVEARLLQRLEEKRNVADELAGTGLRDLLRRIA